MLTRLKAWAAAIGGVLLAIVTLGGWVAYERRGRLKAEALAHLRKEISDVEREIEAQQKELDLDIKTRLRALRARRKRLEAALAKRKEEALTDDSDIVEWVNGRDDG
jgi:septal ring factor EnvC (AmiA/AmiB activator)|tara:strand:- start:1017 stop:1337 length:321 start_codon:yes stop_codon:yes gene_type:complete